MTDNKIKIGLWKDKATAELDQEGGYQPLPFKALINMKGEIGGKPCKVTVFPNKYKEEPGNKPDADLYIEFTS